MWAAGVITYLSALLEFATCSGKLAALGALQNLVIGCNSSAVCTHSMGCRCFKNLVADTESTLPALKRCLQHSSVCVQESAASVIMSLCICDTGKRNNGSRSEALALANLESRKGAMMQCGVHLALLDLLDPKQSVSIQKSALSALICE